jgi:hypothetical protein
MGMREILLLHADQFKGQRRSHYLETYATHHRVVIMLNVQMEYVHAMQNIMEIRTPVAGRSVF